MIRDRTYDRELKHPPQKKKKIWQKAVNASTWKGVARKKKLEIHRIDDKNKNKKQPKLKNNNRNRESNQLLFFVWAEHGMDGRESYRGVMIG